MLLAAGLAAPLGLFAEAPRRRIAWLSGARSRVSPFFEAFRDGLRKHGFEEGRNLEIATYFTDGTPARTEELARAAIGAKPELIMCQGSTVRTVHRLSPRMPVVFGFSGDPVEAGFVKSFAHPGGNMTGMTFMSLEMVGRRIQLLRDILPNLKRVAVLANPQHAGEKTERSASETAALALGLAVSYHPVTNAAEVEPALLAARDARCEAVDVYPDALMANEAENIAAFAVRERLPTVSGWSVFADSGLMMSHGPNLHDAYARVASYADRILRGARPADLPVERPTTIETVFNLRTARALGVRIPPRVLLRADRVIE